MTRGPATRTCQSVACVAIVPAAPAASNCRNCQLLNSRGNADDGIWMDCTGRVESMALRGTARASRNEIVKNCRDAGLLVEIELFCAPDHDDLLHK